MSFDVTKVALDVKSNPSLYKTKTLQDQTANKISNWVLFGSIFLAIGIMSFFIFTCMSTHVFNILHISSETILGIAASTIFVGGVSIIYGRNKPIDSKELGITGIQNTSNNCWLNALLQILLNNDNLRRDLKQIEEFGRFIDKYEGAIKKGENPDSQQLRKFFSDICHDIAIRGRFQDLHEPLVSTLRLLKRINERFKNRLVTTNTFKYSDGITENIDRSEENYGIICLPINDCSSSNLINLIDKYFHSEQDTAADIKTKSLFRSILRVFGSSGKVERRLILEQRKLGFAPSELFFNVQRYHFNPEIVVSFDISIDKKYFENDEPGNYTLEGFACYEGYHYFSYVKKNGFWFLCNDDHVKQVSIDEAKHAAKKAYVLRYTKI